MIEENFQEVSLPDKMEKEAALAKAVAASKRSKEVRKRIHRVTTGRITMVTTSFFKGALLLDMGTNRARASNLTAQRTKRIDTNRLGAISLNHAAKHSLSVSRTKPPTSESTSKPVQKINTPRLPKSSGLLSLGLQVW